MRKIAVTDARTIVIGRAGENGAAQVVWPGLLAKWQGLYGEGTVQLAARRPGDKDPYPAVCQTDGYDITWVVSAADTGRAGIGDCELSYFVGDTVVKSMTWATMVLKSLTGDGTAEPPEEPVKTWFTAVREQIGDLDDLTTKAKENLVAAINEAAKTGSGGSGSISMRTADGYIQYSTDDGASWENLIAVADLEGKPGKDGAPGKDGTSGKDGEDGITPTIGDNGNWYLGDTDTGKPSRGPAGQDGAPGPKGDPGEDGAGMDVAGAAVGQIAKISAVDADGKPTAWEPADLPAGGGDNKAWELLADVTLAEDAASIAVTQTPDGEAFSCRELAIFGRPIGDGTNKAVTVFPYGTSVGYGNTALGAGEILSSTDGGGSYFALHIQALPEVVLIRTQYNIYNDYIGYSSNLGSTNLRREENIDYKYIGDPITKFAIAVWKSGTSGVFRAGTKMKVYGR